MINYQTNVFSKHENKGYIWEADYPHYYFGKKALSMVIQGKVLDIGSGAGALTALWAHAFPSLKFFGIDISKKAIKEAKKRYPNITFKVSSAYPLPFPKNTFSAVVSCEVLEHVEDPTKMLAEISRVLTKGGVLFLTTPLEKDKRTLIGRFYGQKNVYLKKETAGHIQMFSENDLKNLLKKTGFKIVNIYYDRIFIGQLADYFYALYLKKNASHPLALSNKLNNSKGLKRFVGSLLMRFLALIINIETFFLRKISGSAIQIIAIKK